MANLLCSPAFNQITPASGNPFNESASRGLGISLDFPHSGTAETPLEFFDLAEKIAAMPDEVALCLLWWATGFWNGIEEVQRA